MPVYELKVTTAGDAGSAVGEAVLGFDISAGAIGGIRLDYHASAPVTTNVLITEVGGLSQPILTVEDNATDGLYYPERPIHVAVDGSLASGTSLIQIDGQLKVQVTDCDALTDAVVVTVQVLESDALR